MRLAWVGDQCARGYGLPRMSVPLRDPARVALAVGMAVAGVAHFVMPRPFVQHLPEAIPLRGEIVAMSGLLELMLAAGLVGPQRLRRPIGIALAAYFVAVFPANLYAAVSQVPIDGVPTGWIRWARLPLQVPLVLAALWTTARR